MAKTNEGEGIFCLETASWEDDLAGGRTSYEYFLRFLEVSSEGKVPHRHYDVATKDELEFYLNTWKEIQMSYPVLLLAFHGDEQGLDTLDGKKLPTKQIIAHLSNEEEDNDNDAIIHFSSCYPVKNPKMEDLLEDSGALSVSGYDREVDWYDSFAFESLFFAELFELGYLETEKDGPPDEPISMRKFARRYAKNEVLATLGEALGFRLWYDLRDSNKPTGLPSSITPYKQKG